MRPKARPGDGGQSAPPVWPMRPRRYHRDYGHSYTFGAFPTLNLLHHRPEEALAVLVSSRAAASEGVARAEEICRERGIPIEVADAAIERLSPKENIYIVGVFRKYGCRLSPVRNHLLLVNPSDMGNLGTILRTMVGFGLRDLAVITPAADLFDPRVVRSSMGALFQVVFQQFESLEAYRAVFPRACYAFMTQGAVPLPEARMRPPCTLVFGRESQGLPSEYAERCTSVFIPHSSAIDSLNLSVAVGIALYELSRVSAPEPEDSRG